MRNITGFVVFVDAKLNETQNGIEELSKTIYNIKGVTAINRLREPFDIYSVRAAAERAVTEKILDSLK